MSKADKIKILYVDDEVNNLNGFRASFRFDYNVLIANNTDEAVNHLNQNSDIRVILCDQRMPDKSGVQFFQEIRNEYPNPIRMLITGYTDIESVIDAINRGNIFRYIKKPWTDADIQSAIDEGNKFYLTNNMLAIKNEELQKAYNELDKFAYSVSHDMRGPLLSILGAVEVAKSIDNISEIKEMLELMHKSVQKLDDLIQNVHEYYNLKRGELQISEINFNDVIVGLKDFFDMTGKMSNVKFATVVNQQETFRSDEVCLKIILNNLLSNAFKYQRKNNGDKFVELNVEVNRGNVLIYVKDNGLGIDDIHINNIFNMFFRATSEEIGSGFGLYNVKDALRKLNGEISVDSKINEGTTFKVIIPSK
ncbi:MAG TPA: hybrid sensor histidine kinase/response regulator [Flavipsychrobacter sp.]|nr:hybrid sensor histidine kinase/response regulator [Flavipsychrobacter sp.]